MRELHPSKLFDAVSNLEKTLGKEISELKLVSNSKCFFDVVFEDGWTFRFEGDWETRFYRALDEPPESGFAVEEALDILRVGRGLEQAISFAIKLMVAPLERLEVLKELEVKVELTLFPFLKRGEMEVGIGGIVLPKNLRKTPLFDPKGKSLLSSLETMIKKLLAKFDERYERITTRIKREGAVARMLEEIRLIKSYSSVIESFDREGVSSIEKVLEL